MRTENVSISGVASFSVKFAFAILSTSTSTASKICFFGSPQWQCQSSLPILLLLKLIAPAFPLVGGYSDPAF